MPTSEVQKRANEKWRLKNMAKYKQSVQKAKKAWIDSHREEHLLRTKSYVIASYNRWKSYNNELRRLRKIFIEE